MSPDRFPYQIGENKMKLVINGENKIIDFQERPPTLELLITILSLNPKLIVVEFNGVILNQQKWWNQSCPNGSIFSCY